MGRAQSNRANQTVNGREPPRGGQTPSEVHIMTVKADSTVFVKLISFRGMQLNKLIGNGTTYLHMTIVDRLFPEMIRALTDPLGPHKFYARWHVPPDVPRLSCKRCKNQSFFSTPFKIATSVVEAVSQLLEKARRYEGPPRPSGPGM
ncbi:hypothetical protein B5M09_009250 [Aphanomyces astaci]|uniref:Uncharacterized protein n=1 Tax=Aphanomyces astaci TaxID=112090 RepID=A0A425D7P5_APHAT|nr:hypothetical protein B5M09_009250 [Aphanomyces astaci]